MDEEDILLLRADLIQHLQKAYADLRRLADENIQTVVLMKPTPALREAFFELNVHLVACLDYIGHYVRQYWCTPGGDMRAYFLCSHIHLNRESVESRIKKTYPELLSTNPALYNLILRYQPSIHERGSVIEELRVMNNSGKHAQLIPPKSLEQLQGITIHRRSGLASAPPLWIWAKEVALGHDSHLLGGDGSVLGFGGITGASTADILGLTADAVIRGDSSDDIRIYPFLCLWFAEGISLPLLQFSGSATNIVCNIVLDFLATIAVHTPTVKLPPLPIFWQIFASEKLTNDGTITTVE